MMSFPQVLVNDQLIGGFQETVRADQSGQLAQLLAAA
jgi:glutaredoxin 3